MSDPARAMSRQDAFAALLDLQAGGLIRLTDTSGAAEVGLAGWNGTEAAAGNVAGVLIRYWGSGTRHLGRPSPPATPARLDPRNALALVRLCEWLAAQYDVVELYHLGISGGTGARTDCHGEGRAVDLMGAKGSSEDGAAWTLTVGDDWDGVPTEATPGGDWPDGTGDATWFRLDDDKADPFVRDFWRSVYEFAATEWQDRSDGRDGLDTPTAIGEHSFITHPDHPAAALARGARTDHLHLQIGVTGTES